MKREEKVCQNCKNSFVIDASDFGFYEKIKVPPPTFCHLCRAQRRMVFRNERKLFKVKNYFTGEDMFSTYPIESGRRIITREEWNSDNWDAMKYGMEVDFSKPFLEQVLELDKEVPIYNFNVSRMVNSPYAFNATGLKNCYLTVNSSYSENCMYGNAIDYCKDCLDNSHINHSERCYECFWLQNCYQCYFTIMSVECTNLWFSRDCLGCSNCFGCVNLRKSSYCIFNKQYTKEEYEKELSKMRLNTSNGILEARKITRDFWNTQITKFNQGLKNVNSTGSYVTNSKNVNDSFLIRDGENMRYCQYLQVPGSNKDNYDVTNWGDSIELCYETIECGQNSYNNKFCRDCWPACRNCEYSMHLFSSSDCFGCVGLKKKQYCILNKQYTKEEYLKMVEKIKKHMNEMPYIDKKGFIYKYGEFFPIEFSPFGYNNTLAMQHFTMSQEEVEQEKYSWVQEKRGEYDITLKAENLMDSIEDVDDTIIKEIIECQLCKNAYRVLANELFILKKENLPIPKLCGECRHQNRIADRLKLHLYDRVCACGGHTDKNKIYKNNAMHFHGDNACGEKIKTGYSSDRVEIVYCEKCYQSEVY